MLWFNGSIRNAVDKVKTSGALLLVFVQGDDGLTEKYGKYLNEEERFNQEDYVAIKIPHNSEALQHFKQIYISVPVPSVFLIQNNGIPLRVVSSSEVNDIHSAISDVISKQKLKEERKNKAQFNKEHLSQLEQKNSSTPKLKQLQHVKNIGRRITDITEEEIKERLREIRAFPKFWLMYKDASPYPEPTPIQNARIQFRLPNNMTPSWEFPGLSTLRDVREYLMEKMKLSPGFKLLRAYPRTPFTPQDESKTLSELALTPNATLIVVPVQDKTVQAKIKTLIAHRSIISMILGTLFQPLFSVLDLIKKHFFKSQQDKKNEGPRRFPSDKSVGKTLNKKTSTNNIHHFKFEDDTDSEVEHPDNGNSTQQQFPK